MPELPEVETIKNHLSPLLTGKTINNIEVLIKKQFTGDEDTVKNLTVSKVLRKGKVFLLQLSNKQYLSIHLKLSGQLLFSSNSKNAVFKNTVPMAATNKMPGRSTRIIINFTDGSALYFNDMRKFGWIKLGDSPVAPTSPDVLSREFTLSYFKRILSLSKKTIKTILMEQDKIAGIGNIYANESLHEAGISPERKTNSLTSQEVDKLYKAINKIIKKGIEKRGSSGKDEIYILPDGSKGQYQYSFLVYQQEGKNCPRCKNTIKRIKQGGRSSFFCMNCQK